MLVIFFGVVRFFEAHITTSVFNCISTEFPKEMKEDAVRFIGLSDMIAISVGCVFATLYIDANFPCK